MNTCTRILFQLDTHVDGYTPTETILDCHDNF